MIRWHIMSGNLSTHQIVIIPITALKRKQVSVRQVIDISVFDESMLYCLCCNAYRYKIIKMLKEFTMNVLSIRYQALLLGRGQTTMCSI